MRAYDENTINIITAIPKEQKISKLLEIGIFKTSALAMMNNNELTILYLTAMMVKPSFM